MKWGFVSFDHCCIPGIYVMGDTVCCPDHKFRTKVLITQSAQNAGSQVSPSLGIAFSQGECLFQGYVSSTEVAHINDLWV